MYLSSIRLVNFQSWRDLTLDFTEGLNVITGENNAGKSTFFKAIKFTVIPKTIPTEKKDASIFDDTLPIHILYTFSDGSGYRVDYFKGGKLVYYESLPDEEIVQSNTCPDGLVERLSLLIDPDFTTISNMLELDTLLLFIAGADSMHSIMRGFVEHRPLRLLRDNSESFLVSVNSHLNTVRKEKRKLASSIPDMKFIDFDSVKEKLSILDSMLTIVDSLEICTDYVQGIYPVYSLPEPEIVETLTKLSDSLEITCGLLWPRELRDLSQELEVLVGLNDSLLLSGNLELQTDRTDYTDYVEVMSGLGYVRSCVAELKEEKNIEAMDEFLDVLYTFNGIAYSVYQQIGIENERLLKSKKLIDLEKELKDSNAIYDCNIYGKVIYNGRECKPVTS